MVIALGHVRVSEDKQPFYHFFSSSEGGIFLWRTNIPFFLKKDREAQCETIIFLLEPGCQNIAYPAMHAHPMTLKKGIYHQHCWLEDLLSRYYVFAFRHLMR